MVRSQSDKLKRDLQDVEEIVVFKSAAMFVVVCPFPPQRQNPVALRLLDATFTVYTVDVLGTLELPIRETIL